MKRTLSALFVAGALLAAGEASADGPLLFHDESITALYGHDFKVDPGEQLTFTFEHASGWTWGDMFLFVDQINFTDHKHGEQSETYYGEFSPRLSFGKITGTDLSLGPISDVLLAATYERGEDRNRNYLLGPAVDLKLPGFDYFQLNFYYRKPDGITGNPSGQWQFTPVWSYTFPLGNSNVVIDGYMDWVWNNKHNENNDLHANLHFNPQIKYDLGKALGWTAVNHVYVGFEYDYWSDKYAIEDGGFVSDNFVGKTDQNTASLLLKVHF